MKEFDETIRIFETEGARPGVQRDFQILREGKLDHLISSNMTDDFTLHVKLGDGTKVGKHVTFVNITCTISNEIWANASVGDGNYPIAILCDKEDYLSMRDHLKNIVSTIETFKSTERNGATYRIEYYLSVTTNSYYPSLVFNQLTHHTPAYFVNCLKSVFMT